MCSFPSWSPYAMLGSIGLPIALGVQTLYASTFLVYQYSHNWSTSLAPLSITIVVPVYSRFALVPHHWI